jgi:hypothetical protein
MPCTKAGRIRGNWWCWEARENKIPFFERGWAERKEVIMQMGWQNITIFTWMVLVNCSLKVARMFKERTKVDLTMDNILYLDTVSV